jgi:hypothetical protein
MELSWSRRWQALITLKETSEPEGDDAHCHHPLWLIWRYLKHG